MPNIIFMINVSSAVAYFTDSKMDNEKKKVHAKLTRIALWIFQGEMLNKEKQLVKDAAEFLLTRQIPAFVSKPAFQKITDYFIQILPPPPPTR